MKESNYYAGLITGIVMLAIIIVSIFGLYVYEHTSLEPRENAFGQYVEYLNEESDKLLDMAMTAYVEDWSQQ